MSASRRNKPLEQWQLEDAARLRQIFEQRKPGSQERFGATHGIGTQGAVWQYLNGRVPLNLEAALKFARGLSCAVADFSPTLGQALEAAEVTSTYETRAAATAALHGAGLSPKEEMLLETYRKLLPHQALAIMKDMLVYVVANDAIQREMTDKLAGAPDHRVEETYGLPVTPSRKDFAKQRKARTSNRPHDRQPDRAQDDREGHD